MLMSKIEELIPGDSVGGLNSSVTVVMNERVFPHVDHTNIIKP